MSGPGAAPVCITEGGRLVLRPRAEVGCSAAAYSAGTERGAGVRNGERAGVRDGERAGVRDVERVGGGHTWTQLLKCQQQGSSTSDPHTHIACDRLVRRIRQPWCDQLR